MNNKKLAATTVLLAVFAYSSNLYALKTNITPAELDIQFENAENYTDIDAGLGFEERNIAAISESTRKAFQKEANKYLPIGNKLKITITDIDLAGDRSMMTSTFGDYRVYKEIYPPRISFDYAIYDNQERLIASGSENMSDLSYTLNFRGTRNWSEQDAPYVTDLVRDWASKKLREAIN